MKVYGENQRRTDWPLLADEKRLLTQPGLFALGRTVDKSNPYCFSQAGRAHPDSYPTQPSVPPLSAAESIPHSLEVQFPRLAVAFLSVVNMPKNKGKGGKNRRRGKNDNDDDKRELIFKEDGQGKFPSSTPL